MNYAAVLKQHRRDLRLTQEQTARILEVSLSALVQWEAGRKIPRSKYAARIECLPALWHAWRDNQIKEGKI